MDWVKQLKEIWQGKRALGQTTERAAALPVTGSLFTVSGGRVLVTSILGEITAALDGNATSSKLVATPTVGTPRDMCAATDIASYALGDELGISGLNTDDLAPPATSSSIEGQTVPVLVKAGTIGLNVAAGGQVTGRVRWTIKWIPYDPGASVQAA